MKNEAKTHFQFSVLGSSVAGEARVRTGLFMRPAGVEQRAELKPEAQAKFAYLPDFACASGLNFNVNHPDQ